MTSDPSARDELIHETRARLDRVIADLQTREALLGGGALTTFEQARSTALGTAVLAVQYARETVAKVIGDFEDEAAEEVFLALRQLVDTSPQPWGDSALNDLGNITDRTARLVSDIWMLGRLTAAVDRQCWSSDVLVHQCLQVIAETHLTGKLRAELDGLFGETDEPGT